MRRFVWLCLLLALIVPSGSTIHAQDIPLGLTRVYIALKPPAMPRGVEDNLDFIKAAVDAAQAQILGNMPRSAGFEPVYIYETVFGISAYVDAAAWETLRQHPAVESVTTVPIVYPHLDVALPQVNADVVHQDYGLTGLGVNIAVIDTGIDRHHPALADSIIAQRCFAAPNGCPGGRNQSGNAADVSGHGTHVAGIITANGANIRGFAPSAGIVPVRVFNNLEDTSFDNIVAGVDWIASNRANLNVRIINLSIGTAPIKVNGFCDNHDPTFMALRNAIARSKAMAFASVGNHGDPDHVSSPACISNVIGVGSVYSRSYASVNWATCTDAPATAGQMPCHNNAGTLLDILAPGAMINSTAPGGGYTQKGGTSMASPAAAGVAALMLQANPALTGGDILEIMQDTGSLRQYKNGRYYPLLDAAAAVGMLIRPRPFALLYPLENTIVKGGLAEFTWETASGATRYHFVLTRTSQTPDQLLRQNNLTPQSDADPLTCSNTTCRLTVTGAVSDFLVDGTYTWRVMALNSAGKRAARSNRFYVNTFNPAIGLVRNGGFEDDVHASATPQHWTPLKLSKDVVVCGAAAYEGNCAFRFRGSANESSQLAQSPDVSEANLGAGYRLTLSAFVRATGSPSAVIRALIIYEDGNGRDRMTIPISAPSEAGEYEGVSRVLDLRADVGKIKLTLINKSPSGAVFVDRVSMVVAFARRGVDGSPQSDAPVDSGDGWIPLPPE